MTNSRADQLEFASCKGRKVEADFEGGEVSSDGGLLLLREIDRHLDLTRRAAKLLPDGRQRGKITHSAVSLLRQRVFALAQGYEDLNDHGELRHDTLLQTATGSDTTPASAPTLCRMENRANRRCAMALNELLVDLFIESHSKPPEELILDFEATDDPVHGRQEGRFFHGYYDHYCFLPLYVFSGDQPLFAWPRPSRHRWCPWSMGSVALPDQKTTRSVADSSSRFPSRLLVLPLANAALVRSLPGRLHPWTGQEQTAQHNDRSAGREGGKPLGRERRKSSESLAGWTMEP